MGEIQTLRDWFTRWSEQRVTNVEGETMTGAAWIREFEQAGDSDKLSLVFEDNRGVIATLTRGDATLELDADILFTVVIPGRDGARDAHLRMRERADEMLGYWGV